jgi:prepilin-type processing-associated H-X9-DG protein
MRFDHDGQCRGGESLGRADVDAVDAVVGAGWRGGSDERARRVAYLVGLLDASAEWDEEDRRTLVDVTVARVARARSAAGPVGDAGLCPDDEEALNAWVLAGFDATRVPASMRARVERHEALMRALTAIRLDGERSRLVERTLAAVDEWRGDESRRLVFEPPVASRRLGWRDLVSVAAVVLLGVSVVWPMVSAARHSAQRTTCTGQLATVASAMGAYANDWRGSMPLAVTEMAGLPWWAVQPQRPVANSANLFTLPRTGYARLRDLACVGNRTACRQNDAAANAWDWSHLGEVSYSVQIMLTRDRPAWAGSSGRTAVLADRSPVVLRAVKGEWIYPMENSPNHGGRGQNVLFTDGSVEWRTTPIVGQDNIWLPAFIESAIRQALESDRWVRQQPLRGVELPVGRDVFLGP